MIMLSTSLFSNWSVKKKEEKKPQVSFDREALFLTEEAYNQGGLI